MELITWDQSGAGTITYDSVSNSGGDPSAPYSLDVQTTNVEVSVSGSAVNIDVPLSSTIDGTLNGNGSLTITLPPDANTGQVESATLMPSDPTSYNGAVAALNQIISNDNNQAAAGQASASQAAQVSQDQQTAASDTSSLQEDPQTLSGDVNTLAGDVSTTGNDLGTLKNDAAAGQGGSCYNVSTVAYDANSLSYDMNSLSYDLNSVSTDLGNVRGDISKVEQDEHTLQNDGVPVPASMGQAVGAADSAIASAVQSANADIATVNGYVDQGYQIANNLAYGACAGMGPGSPPTPPGNLS